MNTTTPGLLVNTAMRQITTPGKSPKVVGRSMRVRPEAARRELREECGLLAQNLELLMTAELSNSVTDERAHILCSY